MLTTHEGWDQAIPVTEGQLKLFKDKGFKFVGRYINGTWKKMGNNEARLLHAAGLSIMPIYQTTAQMALGDKAKGIEHARLALDCAKALSIPNGTTIYFAVDFDVVAANQYTTIKGFFEGLRSVIGNAYKVGIYAECEVIAWAKNNKVADSFWQTYAWSGGKEADWDVYQYKNGTNVLGFEIDLCRCVIGKGGFWSVQPPSPPLPSKPVLPNSPESIPQWIEEGRGWLVNKLSLDEKIWLADKMLNVGMIGAILKRWDEKQREMSNDKK